MSLEIQDCLVQIGGEWFRFDGLDEDGDYWLERIVPNSPAKDFGDWEPTEDYRDFRPHDLARAIRKFASEQGDPWMRTYTYRTWSGQRLPPINEAS